LDSSAKRHSTSIKVPQGFWLFTAFSPLLDRKPTSSGLAGSSELARQDIHDADRSLTVTGAKKNAPPIG